MKQSSPPKTLQLPFDQYSRQKLAHDVINGLRADGKPVTILDAGGYKGATHLFQPQDAVTVLDVFEVKEKDYIKGDATAMTFADGAFDYVVSFDVFEHIPRDKRNDFVRECARVARRGVIIAAPVGTHQNARAEVFLNDIFRDLHGRDHQWLKEHIDYRLPELGLSGKLLKENGLHTVDLTSNYLPFWLFMQSAIFMASKFDKVGKEIDRLYKEYNSTIYPDGAASTNKNYRIVSVGVKSEHDARVLKKIGAKLSATTDESFDKSLQLMEKVIAILSKAMNEYFDEARATETLQRTIVALKGSVQGQQKVIDILSTEITAIRNSRSFRLATKLSRVRNYPNQVLKRGRKQS